MRDGRPNPDIWGNIITCVEIGEGIYCIFGKDKKGIEMPKEVADELFPESVLTTGKEEADGNVCFTDDVSNAIAVDILEKKGLIKTDKDLSVLDSLRYGSEQGYSLCGTDLCRTGNRTDFNIRCYV